MRITKGEADIGTFHKTENSYRKFCKVCGGHVMTEHPRMRLIDVYANLLQGFAHQPTLHANYGSKTVSVKDGCRSSGICPPNSAAPARPCRTSLAGLDGG